jgi:hypothetical protein
VTLITPTIADLTNLNHTHAAAGATGGLVTAASVAAIPNDGWIAAATWTRTGNLTFTLVGDVTAIYRKGLKVRYKDGGSYEYGVIASSVFGSVTTVTLISNTDYAMAAATITDNYYSPVENPEGFPHAFNFTSTPTRSGTPYTNAPTIDTAKWSAIARKLFYEIQATQNATPGGTGYQIYTTPVVAEVRATGNGMNLSAATGLIVFLEATIATINLFKYDGTYEAVASNVYFFNGSYDL